jgi:hypothetical protein
MATLVLTTIGSVVGGPIGGAIGAVIGQAVDERVLAPKGRRGPRLGDLSVQTSSYGSSIPKLFGTMRVAGTVIWATDLVEAQQSSGGKGQPRTTSYSYSASFAVALSARPIRAVHRIWADGKLLKGHDGDWKTQALFRLHLGDEDQPADPLIASVEGIASTPAYRGIAYAVFEDLQLADFGNRIPSLTFEVEADSDVVPVGLIVEQLSSGAVLASAGGETVTGYAAGGDSVRGAVEVLAGLGGLSISDDGTVMRLGGVVDAFVPDRRDLDAYDNSGSAGRMQIERVAAGALPDEVAIAYYEPARDYQAGLQRARRGGPGRRIESIDLAAALSADAAKAAAERRLAQLWTERSQASLSLPPRAFGLKAGGTLRLPDAAPTFRVAGWTLEHMVAKLRLVETTPATATATAGGADAGRPIREADQPVGTTILALLDLPALDDAAPTPMLWVAAGGTGPGWRKAQLIASLDGKATFEAIGATAQKAVIGTTVGQLEPGETAMFDDRSSVVVELADATTWLENRDDDALVSGANAAMIGDELIQFGRAQSLGRGRYRLSHLLRGRRGSEAAVANHTSGERFVLLNRASLKPLGAAVSAIGSLVHVEAAGVGDAVPAVAEARLTGRALRPPAPVHLRALRLGDGTLRIVWTRRSRLGWSWLDGTDVPLGEEAERYRLTISAAGRVLRTVETAEPRYDYLSSDQAADDAAGLAEVAVVQIGGAGTSDRSEPLQFSL